jgi:hypothetical protein
MGSHMAISNIPDVLAASTGVAARKSAVHTRESCRPHRTRSSCLSTRIKWSDWGFGIGLCAIRNNLLLRLMQHGRRLVAIVRLAKPMECQELLYL